VARLGPLHPRQLLEPPPIIRTVSAADYARFLAAADTNPPNQVIGLLAPPEVNL
jgi:hypothetical protein